ncbi:MAG TPA: ABC transporter ATP-binding protein [Streptosporangiaceae bacterium]
MLRPDQGTAALAAWLMVVDTALALAAPWPLQLVVDYGLGAHRRPAWLSWLPAGQPVLLAALASALGLVMLGGAALAGYQVTYLTGVLTERAGLRLRVGVFTHLLHVRPAEVARYPQGELASRVSADASRVADAVGTVFESLVPDAALLTGMAIITALIDWRLTLAVACLLPIYAVTARRRNRLLRPAQRLARERSGQLAALTTEQLARLPLVQVFDQAAAEAAGQAAAAGAAAEAAVAALDASARFRPVNDIVPGLGLATALMLGTVEVTSGRLSVGQLLVFVAYLSSLMGPVRSLSGLAAVIARGAASRQRIAELLSLPPLQPAARRPGPRAIRPGPIAPPVLIENVSYAHRQGEPVLDRFTALLPGGQLSCLMGPSGAGKSTLLALLLRLADPQSGRILIGGRDIASLPLAELRALVTLVPQDPWLHSGTIAANIAYGRPRAARSLVAQAAERAGVAAFAASTERGLDTEVGEGGGLLSVGQRRRVAIARALLRDAPVLLLDEPVAGLDAATEAAVIGGLLDSGRGRTMLLVTHSEQHAKLARQVIRIGRQAAAVPVSAWAAAPC